MRLRELLEPGIVLHDSLNPILWDNFALKEDVKNRLMNIADLFIEYLNINLEAVTDIILTGSNCSFTYTKFSDLDLHLVINESVICKDCPGDFISDCFNAKRTVFNDNHHITIKGYPVELYAQDESDNLVAVGIFSLRKNEWLKQPEKGESHVDSDNVELKTQDFITQINDLVDNKSDDIDNLQKLKDRLKRYRQSGLETGGELSVENITIKTLRNNGYLQKLNTYIQELQDKGLSLS